MKRIRLIFVVFVTALLLILFSSSVIYAQWAFTGTNASKCCRATVIGQCPFEGCGGDTLLHLQKNITTKPSTSEIEDWKYEDMLYVLFTNSWMRGADRQQLTDWGEGTAIRIKAHLKDVKNYSGGKETTNCNLKKNENNDFHLVLCKLSFLNHIFIMAA